jgi:amidase
MPRGGHANISLSRKSGCWRIIAQFETKLAELKAAGAGIVDRFVVPVLDTVPRPPQTSARFKDDLTTWIARS